MSLFLIADVLFFAVQSLTGTNIFGSAIKALLLTVVVAAIVLGYRFVLLPITLAFA